MERQSLRHFVAAYETAYPQEVVRVPDTVSLEHDVMALVLEYERRRRYPILFFDRVAGSDIPIIANAVASRRALAFALDTTERGLAVEYGRRIKDHVKPVIVADPPFRSRVLRGDDVDLGALPIPEYFPGDAGRYLTGACWSRAIPRRVWRPRATTDSR
jgi:UbiD family decarboxylase